MMSRRHQIYKDLILLLIQRDLRIRYRNSVLGYLWSIMNPLLQMAVLAFVFSHLMRFKIEFFPLFLLSGILTWNFIHQSLIVASNSIIQNGGLMKKVKLPSAIFPIVSVGSALTNFVFAIIPYFLIAIFMGKELTWHQLLLPVIFVPLMAFVVGLSLLIASVNVRFRDAGHMLDPILSILFYGTPIIYPLSVLPEKYAKLLVLNPMVHFINPIRAVLYDSRVPTGQEFLAMGICAIVSLVVGYVTYKSMKNEFIYYV